MVVSLALKAFVVVVVLNLEWAILSPAFLKYRASIRALSPSRPCSIFMELLFWLAELLEQVGGSYSSVYIHSGLCGTLHQRCSVSSY